MRKVEQILSPSASVPRHASESAWQGGKGA